MNPRAILLPVVLRRSLPTAAHPTHLRSCLPPGLCAAPRLHLSTSTPTFYAAKPAPGPLKNDSLLTHLTSSPRAPPAPTVYFIDEQGKDQGPRDLRTLLSSTDRTTHDLVQVATRPNPTVGLPAVPIVKLVSRKAQFDKLKSVAAAKKAAAAASPELTEKEVQVGTKVAPADLAVKANKARDFLAKGYRVKLTVVHKAGSPRGSKQDVMQEVMEQVKDLVASVVKAPHEVGRNWSAIVVGRKPVVVEAKKKAQLEAETGAKEE